MSELIYKDEAYAIIGAAMEAHAELGCGFLEPVYQEAMQIELTERKIPFVAQQELPIFYKGHRLNKLYIADLVAYGKIIVELKAIDRLTGREQAQILNYLKATNMQLGLLINFGAESLEWQRKVFDKVRSSKSKA